MNAALNNDAGRLVWVALPAYNEQGSIGPLIDRIRKTDSAYRILVVDDGSTDRTAAEIRERNGDGSILVYPNDRNRGLGYTIQRCLGLALEQTGADDVVVTMDGDNTHDPALIPEMLRQIDAGADLVIASRYQPGARIIGLSRSRERMSQAASWLFRFLFPLPGIRDYTCGYRAYRAALLRKIRAEFGCFTTESGFTCMADILLRARRVGFNGTEVPLCLEYNLKATGSKMRVARTVRRTLVILLRRRFGIWA